MFLLKAVVLRLHTCLISVLVLLLLSSCLSYRASVISEEGVYYFQKVDIGGIKQSVMIRGQDRNNPVMLYLHGGPGYPLFPVDEPNGVMKQLEASFTMVYWEQRGTGSSYSRQLSGKPLTIDDFVEDTRELVAHVKELLDVEKVFLWGHSWGSNVGALAAARYPELFYAYMSTGQSVKPFDNERLGYDFVRENAVRENNLRALRQLERIDTIPENYGLRDALLLRRWVYRYGGIVEEGAEERPYVAPADIFSVLTAPQYSIFDLVSMIIRPVYSVEALWDDLMNLDLTREAPRIDVPVVFMVGKHDVIVSAELAIDYFQKLEAPKGKELVLFEESAHRPYNEQTDKFLDAIEKHILPLAGSAPATGNGE